MRRRVIMARCDFIGTCPFLNETMIKMPIITQKLEVLYCNGDFTKCMIYKFAVIHGIDKVPKFASPDDKNELSDRMIELVLMS